MSSVYYKIKALIWLVLLQALDLIGPIYRVMDSFIGVREKTSVLFGYGLLLTKQNNLQEARYKFQIEI